MIDEEVLKCAMRKVLDERRGVDEKTHRTHHDFVARLIERERARKERFERIKVHVIGWSAVSAIMGAVYLLGAGLREFINNVIRAKGGP